MNCLTFNIITNILFGDDVIELANKLRPYKNPDGGIEELPLREFLIRSCKALIKQFYHPFTNTVPLLNKYNFAGFYKRDAANMRTFNEALKDMLSQTKDQKSIYSEIK